MYRAAIPGEIRVTAQGLLQLAVYLAVLLLLVKPLGAYMAAVFEGRRTFMSPLVGPVERLIYRAGGIDAARAFEGFGDGFGGFGWVSVGENGLMEGVGEEA